MILVQAVSGRARTAEDHLSKGLAELEYENYDQARANFDRALKLKPNYAEILLEKGFAALKADDKDVAFDAFNSSLALNPNNPVAFFGRGKVRFRWSAACYTEAAEDFTQAIQLKPDYAEAYFLRAKASLTTFGLGKCDGECHTTYLAIANYDRAIADITRFLQLRQNTPQNKPELASAYAIRAQANIAKGFYDQAIADATQTLQLDPAKAVYSTRGLAYYKKGEYVKAIADYTNVLQNAPDDSWVLSLRTEAYLALQNYDAAISDSTQVIKQTKFYKPRIYYQRGLAYVLKGDKQKAIQDFEKVVELTKPSPDLPNWIPQKELLEKAKEQLQKLRSGVV